MYAHLLLIALALVTMGCSYDCVSGPPTDHCAPGGVHLSVSAPDGSPAPFTGSVTLYGADDCETCAPRVLRVDCRAAHTCGAGCRCEPGALVIDDAWGVSRVAVDLTSPSGAATTGAVPLTWLQGGADCCPTRLEGPVHLTTPDR